MEIQLAIEKFSSRDIGGAAELEHLSSPPTAGANTKDERTELSFQLPHSRCYLVLILTQAFSNIVGPALIPASADAHQQRHGLALYMFGSAVVGVVIFVAMLAYFPDRPANAPSITVRATVVPGCALRR